MRMHILLVQAVWVAYTLQESLSKPQATIDGQKALNLPSCKSSIFTI